jgi:hypothetical protein
VLPVEEASDTDAPIPELVERPRTSPLPLEKLQKQLKWEKQLPERYVVASSPSLNSLELQVSIQTTDTGEVHSTKAFLDCGAMGMFANSDFVKRKCLTTRMLSCPIPVYNVDGSPNEAGSIKEVVDVVL